MKQSNIYTEGKETNNSRKNILKINNNNARQDFAHNNVKCAVRNRKKCKLLLTFWQSAGFPFCIGIHVRAYVCVLHRERFDASFIFR